MASYKTLITVMLFLIPRIRRFAHRRLYWVHRIRYYFIKKSKKEKYIEGANKIASSHLFKKIEKVKDSGRMRGGLLMLPTGVRSPSYGISWLSISGASAEDLRCR